MDAFSQSTIPITKPKIAEHPMLGLVHRSRADSTIGKNSKLPLLVILALVLTGLVLAFIF